MFSFTNVLMLRAVLQVSKGPINVIFFLTFIAVTCILQLAWFQLGTGLEALLMHSNCSLFIRVFFKQYL